MIIKTIRLNIIHLRIIFVLIALLTLHNKSTNCANRHVYIDLSNSNLDKTLNVFKDASGKIPHSTVLALRTDPVIEGLFSELKAIYKRERRREIKAIGNLISLIDAKIWLLEKEINLKNIR